MGMKSSFIVLFLLILLKVCEYIILGPKLDKLAGSPEIFVKHPRVNHPRCDACRAIALRFDMAFREADSKVEHLGLELPKEEVADIVSSVCSDYSFRYIILESLENA